RSCARDLRILRHHARSVRPRVWPPPSRLPVQRRERAEPSPTETRQIFRNQTRTRGRERGRTRRKGLNFPAAPLVRNEGVAGSNAASTRKSCDKEQDHLHSTGAARAAGGIGLAEAE